MALLTLNGLYNDSDCYWIISGLQSPFNSEYYLKAGLSAVPVASGSAWEDIEADVLIYEAAGSGTDNYAEGIYVNTDPITLYGFTQAANDLCYPAGGPEEWPGVWTYYHEDAVITPTSKSIGVELTDLDPTYNHTRVFVCYLDGVKKTEQNITALVEEWEYTIAPVYFASPHKIKVQVYSYNKVLLLYEREYTANTLYPTIAPWSWEASNGEATLLQTVASRTALAKDSLVSGFHWKVWNDFVNKVNEARTETGQAWLTEHSTYANAKVSGIYGQLTAARYNATVQNINYPLWSWAQTPGAVGYLGRLLVRGVLTAGADADTVYYQYILEIAQKLNIVISIYNNTADIAEAFAPLDIILGITAAAHSRQSRPAQAALELIIYIDSLLNSRQSKPINAVMAAATSLLADAVVQRIREFIAHPAFHLSQNAYAYIGEVWPMSAELSGSILTSGNMAAQLPVLMEAAVESILTVYGALSGYTTEPAASIITTSLYTAALINKIGAVKGTAGNDFIHSITGNAVRALTQPAAANTPISSSLTAAAIAVLLVYISAADGYTLTPAANGAATNQLSPAQAGGVISIDGYMSPSSAQPVPTEAAQGVVIDYSTLLQLLSSVVSVHKAQSLMLALSASLEVQAVIAWDDPIQTDADLYVRQVYDISQTDNVLALG